MEKQIIGIMEHYRLSPAQFADKIGVQRSSISHILSGRNKPSFDFLHKISVTFPEIDANWLLNGRGNMLKSQEKAAIKHSNPDLFNQVKPNNEITEKTSNNAQEVVFQPITENPANDLFSSEIQEKTQKITNVNSIKQIIFIFENNTFEVIDKK
ncbi:MAG: helix-turn-helix transcriptional regulator [Bacteroidales bacterium]|nr:helix-turn-helix transcriptional regulator [Bacteroidales bacterium]